MPRAEIVAREKVEHRIRTAKERELHGLLGLITRTIVDSPACPEYGGQIDDFKKWGEMLTQHDKNRPVRTARLSDGVAVLFTTEEPLEYRSHKLIVPDSGDAEYERKTVGIASQTLGTHPLHLVGTDELLRFDRTLLSLYYCAGALAVEAAHGWQDALHYSGPRLETHDTTV